MRTKFCGRCQQELEWTKFQKGTGSDGLYAWCRACSSQYRRDNRKKTNERQQRYRADNPERTNAYSRKWRAENPEKVAASLRSWEERHQEHRRNYNRMVSLRKLYGMSLEEYENIMERQDGGCAICGRKPGSKRKHHVDHDHETGKIRGILCSQCNTGLGMFSDDIEKMKTACIYLMSNK